MSNKDTRPNSDVYWTWGSRKIKRDIGIVFLLTLLDSTALMMHMNLLPYLTKDIGLSDITFGYMQTLFGLAQLIGGPLVGRFSDTYGAHWGMLMTFASGTVSYVLLAMSHSTTVAMASRVFGIGMHGLQAGQTVLTAVTTGEERTSAFSRIGIMFGLGLLIGPALGGLLSTLCGHRVTIAMCALICAIGTVLTHLYCPKSDPDAAMEKDEEKTKDGKKQERHKGFSIKNYVSVLQLPKVGRIFVLKNLSAAPIMVMQPILGLHLLNTFAVGPTLNAVIGTFSGVCLALANGIGVVSVRKHLSEASSATLALALLLVGNSALGFFNHIWQLFALLPPLCLGMCLINVICDAKMTQLVPADEQGTVLGLSFATGSAVRTVAPVLSAFLISQFSFNFFGYLSIVIGITTLMLNGGFDQHDLDSKKDD